MYLDGKLLARSWELARPGPLAGQAMLLSASMLDSPNYGNAPDPAVLSRVKVGVGVFYRFKEIKDETGLGDGEGVVVMNGFKEGVALPNDLPQGYKPQELLSFASQTGGMRPGAWLLPEATLLCAVVDEEILQ
jgi:hypothetical protein